MKIKHLFLTFFLLVLINLAACASSTPEADNPKPNAQVWSLTYTLSNYSIPDYKNYSYTFSSDSTVITRTLSDCGSDSATLTTTEKETLQKEIGPANLLDQTTIEGEGGCTGASLPSYVYTEKNKTVDFDIDIGCENADKEPATIKKIRENLDDLIAKYFPTDMVCSTE